MGACCARLRKKLSAKEPDDGLELSEAELEDEGGSGAGNASYN